MALPARFNKEAINKLIRVIEVLSFYYTMNRVLTKTYEKKFALWAAELRGIETWEELNNFINDNIAIEINEQRRFFKNNFSIRRENEISPLYRIKFIFGELDNYIRRVTYLSENSIQHYQRLQLEHILPKTAINIPAEYDDEYIYSNWVAKIGNLTLVESPINQSIGKLNDLKDHAWFRQKLRAYENSSVQLTKTLSSNSRIGKNSAYNKFIDEKMFKFDKWQTEDIELRQEMMKELMLDAWKL